MVRVHVVGIGIMGRIHALNLQKHGYISKCHLCLDIRKCLAKEGFEELQPVEFYCHVAD